MPSLREVLGFIAEQTALEPECVERLEMAIRRQWPGERVYCPPPDSRKDPRRTERAREMARRLPTGVVAERLGVSTSYARRLARKS